jgi:hypothetical protein
VIPGLDSLIVQRIAAIGGDASQAKLQILDEANAGWIARGRPHETMNARIWQSLGGGPGGYAGLIERDGASHYWRLNEASGLTAVDSLGNANGTISGGVTLGVPGAVGSDTAMAFNAVAGGIISAPVVITPNLLSIEGWFRNTALNPAGLIGAMLQNVPAVLWVIVNNQTNGSVFLYDGGVIATSPHIDSLWHHIVCTRDGTTNRVYVDGVLAASGPQTNVAAGTGIDIGSQLVGSLDEIAIYPLALTAQQIRAHYLAGRRVVRSITAGQPGTFAPATAPVPTFAELQGMHPPGEQINPLSPWPVPDYVIAAGGEPCTWTGFDWVVRPSAYQAAVLGDSPSHYWRLNEQSGLTAVDLVGGANGTISGGVTLKQPGAVGDGYSAMAFDGATGKIINGAIAFPVAFTIEAWVRTAHTLQAVIVTNYAGGPGDIQWVTRGDGKLQIYAAGQTPDTATATHAVNNGQWHHVAVTHDGVTARFFVDGALDVGIPQTHLIGAAPSPLTMGVEGAAQWWNGLLDEIAIYPRALTAAEILAHYHAAGR